MPPFRTLNPAILAGYLAGFAKQPHANVPIPPFWRDLWRVPRLVNHERFKGNLVANQVIAGEWALRVQAQSLRVGPASISRNDFSTIRLYVSFPTAWLSKALVP